MKPERAWRFIVRHRTVIANLSLIVMTMLGAGYAAFAFDLFENESGLDLHHAEIELDEALALGVLLVLLLLVFGIRHYLGQKRELAGRVAAERHVRELAYQDTLTGLPNRRQYDDALGAAIHQPPRAGASHAVFLMDLNGFKQINDLHGHGVGDEVLIHVAERLLSAMRGGDMVARFGGDEFAILATHLADPEAATNIALRVIEALDAPISAGGAVHRIGVGIGIALVPGDAEDVEEALRRADVALYRAKAERRSALRFFEEDMDIRVRARAALEQKLREAIEEGRIEVVFRPAFDLRTHEVVSFEASPRWREAGEGEVPPERFIAIAEEVGLIHALGERVLRQACAAARNWPETVGLSVDIHGSQLKDQLLAARIVRLLAETGIAPERLEVELTESALVADVENARAVIGALRAAGIRVALDNFGTGYSSLYHLRSLRLDKVKIDRSFIQAMNSGAESAGIVHALVGLGHGLGMTVAAEGIEASDQAASLLGSGCEQGQGDMLSLPLSPADARRLFTRKRRA